MEELCPEPVRLRELRNSGGEEKLNPLGLTFYLCSRAREIALGRTERRHSTLVEGNERSGRRSGSEQVGLGDKEKFKVLNRLI